MPFYLREDLNAENPRTPPQQGRDQSNLSNRSAETLRLPDLSRTDNRIRGFRLGCCSVYTYEQSDGNAS